MPKGCAYSNYALNHVTAPRLSWRQLVDVACRIGAGGVELRTDLGRPIFGDDSPEAVKSYLRSQKVDLLALAEVSAFNDASPRVLDETAALARLARLSGAGAVIFIPRVGGDPVCFSALTHALSAIKPYLMEAGVRGLIEPIGFCASTLRDFAIARRAIDEVDGGETFGIVHDTFHHHLSGGGTPSARYVELIHVSGIEGDIQCRDMTDAHRGLVTSQDALCSARQVAMLRAAGCAAPVSIEAFSPLVQANTSPAADMQASINVIEAASLGALHTAVSMSATAPSGAPV